MFAGRLVAGLIISLSSLESALGPPREAIFFESGRKRVSSFYDYNVLCVYPVPALCFYADQPLFYPLLFAKFGRFTPNRLALIGHGLFRKSLIMNKSSLKNASHVNKCKKETAVLS